MPRRARIHFVSLRSSLVNLPISIYGPLLERSVRPQSLAIHLQLVQTPQDTRHVEASGNNTDRTVETIEIDPQYSQSLGFTQDDVVEVGLLYDLAMAKSVAAEPLTSDDWEIIEIHASHVESTLLSQVRVAKAGQEIDVWAMGRTRIRLKVVSVDPKVKENPLLLTTNTEVVIAPKPHQSEKRTDTARKTKKSSADDSITQSAATHSVSQHPEVVRVLPHKISSISLPGYTGQELVAYVSPSTFAKLHDGRKGNSGRIACRKSTFERLVPPADPLLSSSSEAPSSTPKARVLIPDNGSKGPEDTDHVPSNTIFVGPLTGLPESHISFPAAPGALESWDLLVLYPSPDDEEIVIDEAPGGNSPIEPFHPVSSKLAGVDDILQRCIDFCIYRFIYHAFNDIIHGVSSLLVTGRPGTGKTSIVDYVAKVIQADPRTYTYTHFVDVARYTEHSLANIKSLLQYWFDKAAWHKPSILVLDNLDKLLGPEVEHADSFRTRHITELFLSLYSSSVRSAMPNSRGVILIATATSTSSLHPLINASHLFQQAIDVKPPNTNARKEIIEHIVLDRLDSAQDIQLDLKSPPNYMVLATQTEGHVAKDLQDLVGRAIHQVAIKAAETMQPALLSSADFVAAQVNFTPLSLRDVKTEKSEVAWSDIGGLQGTRRILRETLEWPTKYGPIFAQSPLRLRSGLLLYGHPGCGKTLLASAVAKECGLNFISVKGPEILNKYIGASEKSVRDLFERASTAKPCVLFFDEFDSIAPKRGHDSTGVTDRVVNQMLTQMDGAEGLEGVYVLAATSRPDLIDSALLRPGRLDKSLLCGMPDYADRREILGVVGRRVSLAPSVDLDEFAEATDGFSGADLQALMYNAHLDVIHASLADVVSQDTVDKSTVEFTVLGESLSSQPSSKAERSALEKRISLIKHADQEKADARKPMAVQQKLVQQKQHIITADHLRRVLKTTRPSVSTDERLRLDRIYRAFVSDRSGDLPVPPDGGGIGNRVSLM